MSLAGCSNLNSWVRDLDKKVEAVLAKRLEKVIVRNKYFVYLRDACCARAPV